MNLLNEFKTQGIDINMNTPLIKWRVFEDNSSTSKNNLICKYYPKTKYLNVKLHHFHDYITRGDIKIKAIDTTNQLANYITKPVNKNTLTYLRKKVMGW